MANNEELEKKVNQLEEKLSDHINIIYNILEKAELKERIDLSELLPETEEPEQDTENDSDDYDLVN